MNNLTNQQRAFVREYVRTLDVKKAAQKAGYSRKRLGQYGKELLKKPFIRAAIEEYINEQIESLQVNKAYIIARLLKIIEFSLEREDILDKDGNKTGKTKIRDSQSSLRALDYLAKQIGIELETIVNPTIQEPKITIIDNLDENKI